MSKLLTVSLSALLARSSDVGDIESVQLVPRFRFNGGDKSSAPIPPLPITIPPNPTFPPLTPEIRLAGFTIVPIVTDTLDSGEGNAALDALIKPSSLEESGMMNAQCASKYTSVLTKGREYYLEMGTGVGTISAMTVIF